MSYLVLVRHGESEWNAKGWWTGITDVHLTEKGISEAEAIGRKLADVTFHLAYTSRLVRAMETLQKILDIIGQHPPITEDAALNERDYGIYTGKNKWNIQKDVGDVEFQKIRRSWDMLIPQGESLKQVYERVVPYYQAHIQPSVISGKNVLLVAHGNSLRALIKYLENIPDEKIASIELKTGEAWIYQLDNHGKITGKEVRSVD